LAAPNLPAASALLTATREGIANSRRQREVDVVR
jgi:hypothetical protein